MLVALCSVAVEPNFGINGRPAQLLEASNNDADGFTSQLVESLVCFIQLPKCTFLCLYEAGQDKVLVFDNLGMGTGRYAPCLPDRPHNI